MPLSEDNGSKKPNKKEVPKHPDKITDNKVPVKKGFNKKPHFVPKPIINKESAQSKAVPLKQKNNNKSANTEIEKRNKLIVKLFRTIDLPIRLIGDDIHPAIVYNDEIELNCIINNFELKFLDAPSSKNVIYTVKLNENPRFDKNQILKCISDYKAKSVFKVSLDSKPKLFLSGYAFLNKEDKQGRYPIFSSYHPRIYFSEEKAKEISEELKSDGYSAIFE